MENPERSTIANLIYARLKDNEDDLKKHFDQTSSRIGYFFLDDILPEALARSVFEKFPSTAEVHQKKSLKQYKYVAAQMNQYHPLLEALIFAFQDSRIVDLIAGICKYEDVVPDENLYAGGISMMGKNNFLNPHLDNSHDKDRKRWRVLNLLYYVTPDWKMENGGHLELWPQGIQKDPLIIPSSFNRLVVMATHNKSWHSVNTVEIDAVRCCVSNYYFSEKPIDQQNFFHVTTFRGRPGQYIRNKFLQLDGSIRMGVRRIFKKGIVKNPHVYKKEK